MIQQIGRIVRVDKSQTEISYVLDFSNGIHQKIWNQYLLFDKQYFPILKSIEIPPILTSKSSDRNIYSKYDRIRKENNISKIDFKFQSLIPSYYPQLPIHMFTQNLSSLRNQSKLILLGNGFFGDEKWGLRAVGKTSTEISKILNK